MQKTGNLYLKTDTTLSVSIEENDNLNSEALTTKLSTTQNDNFDHKHQVTNFIREEVVLQHRPPKDSLSELIFLNKFEELKIKLDSDLYNPNEADHHGSTHSWTPLYWAVKLRRLECMHLLLSYGVDINIVINDCDECCGTVLDLATLRDDNEIEEILREYAEKEDVNLGQSFKAIRTKLRGKAPAFNFRYYGKNKKTEVA